MKLLITLTLVCVTFSYTQRTTKTNPLDFRDTVGIKLNLTTNGKARMYLGGSARVPTLTIDVADSSYQTANIATIRMLSPGLTKTLVQLGVSGDGQFFVSGRTPLDSNSAFTQFVMIKKDSSVFNNAIKFGSISTTPTTRGFMYRNGNGDTLEFTYGNSPSVAKISFNGGASGSYMRQAADGVYKPSTIPTSDLPERHIGYAWYSVSAQDSVRVFELPQSATVDSIRVIRTGGTSASVMVKRDRGGSMADMLSANYTTTTSMATPTGLQNNSMNANDVVWAVIRAISGTVTEIFIQVNYH